MKNIKQIIDEKGNDIWSVVPDTSVYEVIKILAEKRIGALLVMEGEKVVGIVSERDYARKVILQGKAAKETSVKEIMTSQVICTHLDSTIEEGLALMTSNRIRHLPMIDNDKLVGMVSIGDLVKALIEDQKFMIDQMTDYITG